MKRILLATCAVFGLSACAEGYYGPYGGGGIAYYDDFYGPYDDGYWGPDGSFYYRNGHGGPFVRDEGRHFQRSPMQGSHGVYAHPGFHGFHGSGHGGGHGGGGHGGGGHGGGPPGGGGGPHG